MNKKKSFIRKFSQKDVPRLKRKLWTILSRKIKERDGNTCFSCGRDSLTGSGWHAGHMFPAGSHNSIRFHPGNIFSQCYNCNINLGGNGAVFAARFIGRYGKEKFDSLSTASRVMKQWKAFELLEMISAIEISLRAYTIHYEAQYGPELGIY